MLPPFMISADKCQLSMTQPAQRPKALNPVATTSPGPHPATIVVYYFPHLASCDFLMMMAQVQSSERKT